LRAENDTATRPVNSIGNQHLVAGGRGINRILNGCGCRDPIRVRRCGVGAVQIHVKHRGRGVEDAKHEEGRSQLMKATLHNLAFPNIKAFVSGTGFLFNCKIAQNRR
jgi:hypothetical protein